MSEKVKMHRVVVFVKDINNENSQADLKTYFENMRHPEFTSVLDIKTTTIGEYDDDHELNKTKATLAQHEAYFPELKQLSPEKVQQEIQKERELRIKAEDKANDLQSQIRTLEARLKNYQEIEALVKKIKSS